MKAWQFVGAGSPLTLADVPEPSPGPGEVAVSVRAVGLCHTDVGILHGGVPESILGPLPLTLGHEVAGVVSSVGDGVESFSVGDRVAMHMSTEGPGFAVPGGYAATSVLSAERIVPLPPDVGFAEAAAATDAGMTPMHAVKIGGVGPNSRVAIVGLGGLGFNGAQIALALGARVFAAEPREAVHARALELGVSTVVSSVSELADFDVDVVLDFAGYGTTTADAVTIVRPGGHVVLVGFGRGETTIDTISLIQREVRLIGCNGGSIDDLRDYYELVDTGRIRPVVTTIGFDDIGEGLQRVADGNVEGRLVAVFDNSGL